MSNSLMALYQAWLAKYWPAFILQLGQDSPASESRKLLTLCLGELVDDPNSIANEEALKP